MMRILRPTAVALAAVLPTLFFPASARAATVSDVEAALAAKINQGRAGQGRSALITHTGLQGIAGDWSAQMAATNNLTHGNAEGRIDDAAPDPAEANGAPDDGFAGWCENIAWNSLAQSSSADQVAQMFYNQWFNSTTGHKECMLSLSPKNFGQNVMGVGVVYDSAHDKWWATTDIAKDETPPSVGSWRRYEQGTASVAYSGTWTTFTTSSASNGSYRRSETTGSWARFTFTGTGVRWIGIRGPSGGYAEVRLDGTLIQTVNQYSLETKFLRKLIERLNLPRATHTLEVRVKGTKHSDSSGYRTWVDAFERFA